MVCASATGARFTGVTVSDTVACPTPSLVSVAWNTKLSVPNVPGVGV